MFKYLIQIIAHLSIKPLNWVGNSQSGAYTVTIQTRIPISLYNGWKDVHEKRDYSKRDIYIYSDNG